MIGDLIEMLIRHEGLELYPYKCHAGKLTIGVGRNIEELGITREEAIYLLRNDITRVEGELNQFDWFQPLSRARKDALIDMCFNLGLTRFRGFEKMIAAFEEGDYLEAEKQMLDSKWARQVGDRALDLAAIIGGER